MSSFSFDPTALDAILSTPAAQAGMARFAQPNLLEAAKENCSVLYPGGSTRNPAPGYNSGTAVYMRGDRSKMARRAPGQFRDTLQLEITADGELSFFSPAVSDRRGFAYGQALIDGTMPFKGAYRLLPPEYYT